MATLIRPNSEEVEVFPSDAADGFTLDELYKLLECETVQMIHLADDKTMWMDEESKLKPYDLVMDYNPRATELLHDAGGMPDDYIIGSVLIAAEGEVK